MENTKDKFISMFVPEEEFRKVSEYAEALGVSSKTIYNYLNELEPAIELYNLRLEKRSGKGIVLRGTMEEKLRFCQSLNEETDLSVLERRDRIYEELVMYDRTLSINTLADAYFVSRSSVVNDFESVEKRLKAQNLFLLRTKVGTYAGGDERFLRTAKINYIYKKIEDSLLLTDDIIKRQVSSLLKNYCESESVQIAEEMISYLKNELYININIIYYLRMLIGFTIFVQRIKEGHSSKEEYQPMAVGLYELKTYPVVRQMLEFVSYDLNQEIRPNDVEYVNRLVNAIYKDDGELIEIDSQQNVEQIVAKMIEAIKDIFTSDISSDTLLINGLSKHVANLLYRLKGGIKISNPYLQQIKKQYASMYSIVSLACSIIENALGIPMSEDEISYILIHFQAAVERANMSKKIVIVVESRDAYATLLESGIRRSFVLFDVIEIVERKNIQIEDINAFDFVVSTMHLEDVTIPHIQISSVDSRVDMERIQRAYNDYRMSDSKKFSFIRKSLQENTVLLQKDYQSDVECLQHVCSLMHEDGCVDERFLESVLKREMITPTNVTEEVALPHGLDKHVKKNRIGIITTRKPIVWGKGNVSVIFLLAVNFSDATTTKKLLAELYSFISNKTLMEQMKICTTYEEVLRLFR